MAHGDPAVGSVAEEAARLIGLLCGDPSGEAAREAGMRAATRSGVCPTCGREASPGAPPPQSGTGGSPPHSEANGSAPQGEASGSAPQGEAGAAAPQAESPRDCRYCPVCQVVGFVRGISPEVLDRVADVVDLLSGGIRDLAESRRAATVPPPGSAADTAP